MNPAERPNEMTREELAFLDAQRAEVRRLVREANREEMRKKLKEMGEEGSSVRGVAKIRINTGKREEIDKPLEGKVGERGTLKHRAKVIETYVKEIVKAYKDRPDLRPVPPDSNSGKLLDRVLRKIEDPENNISTLGAAYLYKFLDQLAQSSSSNPLGILSEQELQQLNAVNSSLFNRVYEGIIETAQEIGRSSEEIENFQRGVAGERGGRGQRSAEEIFEGEWQHGGLSEFFDREYDYKVIRSLFSIDNFAEYIRESRSGMAASHPDWSADKVDMEMGEKIESEIVSRFSKIFLKADNEKPKEFYNDIVRIGFTKSIENVFEVLKRRVELLIEELERGKGGEDLQNMKLFRRYSHHSNPLREVEAGGVKRTVVDYKLIPTPVMRKANMAEFLRGIVAQASQENDTRQYLHNVRALFLRGAGKDGFWPQLASYAQQFPTTEIDSMMLLPDRDMFMTATRLYTKYLEEEFAKYNWIHQSPMFSPDTMNTRTLIEERIVSDLRRMFADKIAIKNERGEKIGEDLWRIRRAMGMGVGIARGVFLTEPEMAAWAEPALTQEGTPHYQSYYTNDNAALAPLNPLHHFYRWQAEGTLHPLLFLPVAGIETKFSRMWEHKSLWKNINDYKKVFLQGQQAFTHKKKGETLFLDLLYNWGKAGSFISRSGWRFPPAYEGWLVYKETNGKRGGLNILNSWKGIENIGFEALINFTNSKINNLDFLAPASPEAGAERDSFFKYIYRKYINHGANEAQAEAGLQAELARVKQKSIEEVDKKIKLRQVPKDKRDREITKEMYMRVAYKALAGVLRDRIPTKIVRVERNRSTQNGIRAWEAIRSQLGWTAEDLDNAMQGIMMVESTIREETTEKMNVHLRDQPETEKRLWDFETNDYVVTKEKIDSVLSKISPERRERALQLFETMQQNYLTDEKMNEWAEKLQNKHENFPYSIAADELETSFMSYRGSGQRTMERALGDTGMVETNMFAPLKELLNALQPVSLDPKHDISTLITPITKIKQVLEDLHGKEEAHKMVHHLSAMIISYFKKDTMARIPGGGFFGIGEKHSLAAEFVGLNREVWEWNVSDIDKFISELERRRLLPKEPYELQKNPDREDNYINIPFIGKVKWGVKMARDPDYMWYSKRLRDQFGASNLNMAAEMTGTYLPIVAFLILYKFISDAIKEAEGSKK